MLSKKCYTILVKNKYLSAQGATIDANDLTEGNQNNTTTTNKSQLPESNIGHKLLQMMGWTGGGLGKGISIMLRLEIAQNSLNIYETNTFK